MSIGYEDITGATPVRAGRPLDESAAFVEGSLPWHLACVLDIARPEGGATIIGMEARHGDRSARIAAMRALRGAWLRIPRRPVVARADRFLDMMGGPFDQSSTSSPSKPAKSISASRVWKPRFNAAWNRLWASAVCAPSPKRSESRRKSATGARAIALTRSLTATRPAPGNLAIR